MLLSQFARSSHFPTLTALTINTSALPKNEYLDYYSYFDFHQRSSKRNLYIKLFTDDTFLCDDNDDILLEEEIKLDFVRVSNG